MLRIEEYLIPGADVENFDFSLLTTLRKKSPSFIKGRKVSAKYLSEDGELVVEKLFSDVIEDGHLTKLKMTINWYNDEDEIKLTKEQIVQEFNKVSAGKMLWKRRVAQMHYLEASAKGTPIESHVAYLFHRYRDEIAEYEFSGSVDFLVAIQNETDPTAVAYLNIVLDAAGTKVIDSITNQITSEEV